MNNKPLVSTIVTNYNGWELGLLKDFFNSFLKDTYRNFEILFVDMNSSDSSVENVKKQFGSDKRLKIIVNPVNNMSSGINMAMEQARGKYILFLNNDIYFNKGTIKTMVDFMENNKDTALVQGKIVSYFDHNKIDSAGETMDIFGNPVTIGAGETDKGQYEKVKEVLSVAGAASLLRKDLLKKVGPLDPHYAIGYEDMDLAIRLRLTGYKVYYLPKALLFHRRASSTSRAPETLRVRIKFWFNKNRLSTIIKNYEVGTLLKSLPFVLLIYIASGLFEIFYKRLWRFGLTRFQAIGWVLVNMPALYLKRKKIQKVRKMKDKDAIMPFMATGRFFESFRGFLVSKHW